MKKLTSAALAALALAAILPTSALADDPVSPKQGAVCNLYLLSRTDDAKKFSEIAASLASAPAAATFVDSASDFKPSKKQNEIASNWGMWMGWIKQEKAGTYTFTCRRGGHDGCRYSIWINGQKCVEAKYEQSSFNVELNAGFNSIKIVASTWDTNDSYPLTLTYKKAGSVKDPISFGPSDMFYDDEEE